MASGKRVALGEGDWENLASVFRAGEDSLRAYAFNTAMQQHADGYRAMAERCLSRAGIQICKSCHREVSNAPCVARRDGQHRIEGAEPLPAEEVLPLWSGRNDA